jgi:hypothetical protein
MRWIVTGIALVGATACARAAMDGEKQHARAARAPAALDSSRARTLCANADSVIRAGHACALRDQGSRMRILP